MDGEQALCPATWSRRFERQTVDEERGSTVGGGGDVGEDWGGVGKVDQVDESNASN